MGNSKRISNVVLEFADIFKEHNIECKEEINPSNKLVKRFIRMAKEVPDVRMKNMIDYPLHEILLIAFFAVLSGAETWTEIAQFGKVRVDWLKSFLKFKNGTPSHDTFRRVFSLVSPNIFQSLIVDFLMENMTRIKLSLGIESNGRRLINVDGKQANGTGRKSSKNGALPNLQTLNIYDASNCICIAMKDIDSKTNEIPTAQEVLKYIDIKNAIVTCDALNTQKGTVNVIVEGQADYAVALKRNQHTFYDEVDLYFSEEKRKEIRESGEGYITTIEKAHSKTEIRNFYFTDDVRWFHDRKEWKKLRSFICYEKLIHNHQTNVDTVEIRYFISSLTDPILCAEAIRGHWSVENILHWHLDASFGDDRDMTTDKNAYMNFSAMRRMALTLCKISQTFMKCSVKSMRWMIGLEYKQVLGTILGTLDEDFIEQSLISANKKK
ncbi:MAG: ISAs1 family transposase [Oscillospiraceae bacterium]|jgi:predicted transposase YbfD/YdcC|nr:ISAs1 family transposase [Oscillospiraceae bacterium]